MMTTHNEIALREGATPEPYDRPGVPRISPDFVRPRLPEVGRIRLGEKDEKKGYPKKLGTFRFTSRDRSLIESVAALYGGQVAPWDSDDGKQWQVTTTATTIPVVVPRAQLAFSQWFENWDGAVCRRRCDGHRDIVRDCPCTCDPTDRVCLPTTRLSVLLPSVPGLGVWRVESHGFNAAAEILGTIELAAAYGAALLPANLTLAQRTKRRPDPKHPDKIVTNRFVVPVLSITASVEDMVEAAQLEQSRRLGILPSGRDHASDRAMRGLRAAVFTRWPASAEPGPERDRRLAQLSSLLGREVRTISADHDLTESEALELASMVDELPDDTQPAPLPGQAAPALSSTPGADLSAPPGSAVETTTTGEARNSGAAPAEHHTAEDDREAAPADGTALGGPDRSDTGQPSGAAPAPRRQRAPKPVDLRAEQAKLQAMKNAPHEATEHAPSKWLHSFGPGAKGIILNAFGGSVRKAEAWLAPIAEQEAGAPLAAFRGDWPESKVAVILEALKAEKGQS